MTPERRVTSVQLSRDSLSLEVGDGIALRAEARDGNGAPIVDVQLVWLAPDPNVVTLSMTGGSAHIAAVGAGTGRVVASAGTHADTAIVSVPAPLTATTLSVHADTLEALGEEVVVEAVSQSATGPRSGSYTATARNPAVVQASATGRTVTLLAQAPGATYITVVERHGTRDSLLAVVQQRATVMELSPDSAIGLAGRTLQLVTIVKDPRGMPIQSAPVIFTTLDSSLVAISTTGVVTGKRIGTGYVEARIPGGPADTSAVTVLPTPRLLLRDSVHLGSGLLVDGLWVDYVGGDLVTPWVKLSIGDTSVAAAPDSVLDVHDGGVFRVVGKRAGTTLLVASSALMVPDTLAIVVSTSRVDLSDVDYGEARSPLLPLGSESRFVIVAQDSLGATLDPADSVLVSVISSDTGVVVLPQNGEPYAIRLQGQGSVVFPVVPVDTGTAWVVARPTAPGFRADSLFYVVTAMPKVRFREGRLHVIGAGQRDIEAAAITTTQGWDHGGDILVTFARRHPEVALVPDTLTLPVNALAWPYHYTGLVPGTDTIVASSPGFEPDTAVIVVTTPHFILPDTVHGNTLGGGANVFVGDSLGSQHSTDGELLVLATPSDTTVARDSSTRIPSQWSAFWTLSIPVVDTGTTTVAVTDSAGRYAPHSLVLRVALANSIHLALDDGYQYGAAAPGQRFESTRFLIFFPPSPSGARVAHLAATNPGVLRIPDTVVLAGQASAFDGDYTYFSGVAGDTAGTTRIVVTSPGFVADTSGPVSVLPGRLRLVAPYEAFVGYSGYSALVEETNDGGWGLELDSATTFSLVPLDSGIVIDSALTVASGEHFATVPVTFTSPGHLRLAVVDHRAVSAPYRGDTVSITVVRPRLRLALAQSPVIGVGQRILVQLQRSGNAADELTVTVAHSGTRTTSVGTLLMPTGIAQLLPPFAIDGRAAGTDTVVVSAPRYDPDTLTLQVGDGAVSLYNWPGQLRQGDSAAVTLSVRDSVGQAHPVVDATTFTIVKEGGIVFTDGQREITAITVPAGSASSSAFRIKAVGPAGTASVRFVNLYYAEQAFQLTVTP